MTQRSSELMGLILAVDAIWDILLGIGLCLVPWAPAHWLQGLAIQRTWVLFPLIGIGSMVFGGVMVRAWRGVNTLAVCRVAAVGNGLAALVVVGLMFALGFGETGWTSSTVGLIGTVVLVFVAVLCSAFAALEWRVLRTFSTLARKPASPEP